MIIKETSKKNPELFLFRNLKEDFKKYGKNPLRSFETYEDFVKDRFTYYENNKEYVKFEIVEEN